MLSPPQQLPQWRNGEKTDGEKGEKTETLKYRGGEGGGGGDRKGERRGALPFYGFNRAPDFRGELEKSGETARKRGQSRKNGGIENSGARQPPHTFFSPLPISGQPLCERRKRHSTLHPSIWPISRGSRVIGRGNTVFHFQCTAMSSVRSQDPAFLIFSFSFSEIPLNPCKQFCEAKRNGKSVDVVQVEVENGTACHDSLSSFDVCIQGKCQVFYRSTNNRRFVYLFVILVISPSAL